jgi:transposase-like protein
MMVSFKGAHFGKDVILTCVRWYVAYPLSYRHLEEMMQEPGVSVDHAMINRWVLKYSPPCKPRSMAASGRPGSASAWTQPTSGYAGNGATSIVRWTKRTTPLTFS